MFASLAWLAAAQLSPIVVVPLGKAPRQVEQPRAPIETSGPLWAEACKDKQNDWNAPAPPVRIHGNSYFVGTCGISAILITDPAGHILIDAGTAEGADLIADNIRALGFRLRDIRYLLHSHEHFDHVGGMARLQRLTGATVIASAAAAKVLETGTPGAADPQAGMHKPFDPVAVGRIVRDGSEVRLGDNLLTAIATPGHTPGALSWSWTSCDGGVCRAIVYADSLTPVSRDGYRFSDHPAELAAFRASIARIGGLAGDRCEILVTPHPSASGLGERFARGKTLLDPAGCQAYAAALSRQLDERLAKEASAR